MAHLKVSVTQQLEEVRRTLDKMRKEKPLGMSSDLEFFISRMEAVERSLTFIAEHKDLFLKLVNEKGMPDGMRRVDP